jgi:hypothetical protein
MSTSSSSLPQQYYLTCLTEHEVPHSVTLAPHLTAVQIFPWPLVSTFNSHYSLRDETGQLRRYSDKATEESGLKSRQGQDCSLFHSVKTGFGAHPASHTMGTRGKAAWAWSRPLTSIQCRGQEWRIYVYLHSPIRLHGVVLNQLGTRITLLSFILLFVLFEVHSYCFTVTWCVMGNTAKRVSVTVNSFWQTIKDELSGHWISRCSRSQNYMLQGHVTAQPNHHVSSMFMVLHCQHYCAKRLVSCNYSRSPHINIT